MAEKKPAEKRPDRTLGLNHDTFWDWCGKGELRLQRIDAGGEVRQGAAGRNAAYTGRNLGADFRLEIFGAAAGEDAALDRVHLLLEPIDAPFDPLLGGGGHGRAGEKEGGQ